MKINWSTAIDLTAAAIAIAAVVLHMFGGEATESIYYLLLAIVLFVGNDRMRDR